MKKQVSLKITFCFFLFPHKQNTKEPLRHGSIQVALSANYNSQLVSGRALVLHSTLFFFHKLKSFLESPAKVLLMNNKHIRCVYIALLYAGWPRRVPAVCINSTSITRSFSSLSSTDLSNLIFYSHISNSPLMDLFSYQYCIS